MNKVDDKFEKFLMDKALYITRRFTSRSIPLKRSNM